MKHPLFQYLFSAPFILIGLVAIPLCTHIGFSRYQLLKAGHQSPGVITKNEWVRGSKSGSYYAHYEYEVAGIKYHGRSSVGSKPAAFSEGEPIVVLYEPNNPSKGHINSFSEMWLLPILGNLLGLIFVSSGILIIRTTQNELKRIRRLKETGLRLITQVRYRSQKQQSLEILKARNPDSKVSTLSLKLLDLIPDHQIPYLAAENPRAPGELVFEFPSQGRKNNQPNLIGISQVVVYMNPENPKDFHIALDEPLSPSTGYSGLPNASTF